ncbi:ribonuclease H-like domain-containing protein [Tanacetum coccineum]|uniref:Ribonuclease H-like domain-containing protein n=1 Tax=Tanacetum coccineum TaxID=301880 RepID=A0ABQ5F4H5_9ASTR
MSIRDHFLEKQGALLCSHPVLGCISCLCGYFLCLIIAEVLINGLDVSNRLLLHANDNSDVPIVNFKSNGADNYKMCRKIALNGKNKMGFVDGHVYSKIAFAVWNELKKTYDKMDGYVIFHVIHKINGLKQGDLSVPDYYHRLKSLWREFDTLILQPACTFTARGGGEEG